MTITIKENKSKIQYMHHYPLCFNFSLPRGRANRGMSTHQNSKSISQQKWLQSVHQLFFIGATAELARSNEPLAYVTAVQMPRERSEMHIRSHHPIKMVALRTMPFDYYSISWRTSSLYSKT